MQRAYNKYKDGGKIYYQILEICSQDELKIEKNTELINYVLTLMLFKILLWKIQLVCTIALELNLYINIH